MDFKALATTTPARQTSSELSQHRFHRARSVHQAGSNAGLDVVLTFLDAGEETGGQGAGESSGTSIIMFADIVDSTALTETHGDAAFRTARVRSTPRCARSCRSRGMTIDAKTLGAGVLDGRSCRIASDRRALRCGAEGEAQGLPLQPGRPRGRRDPRVEERLRRRLEHRCSHQRALRPRRKCSSRAPSPISPAHRPAYVRRPRRARAQRASPNRSTCMRYEGRRPGRRGPIGGTRSQDKPQIRGPLCDASHQVRVPVRCHTARTPARQLLAVKPPLQLARMP